MFGKRSRFLISEGTKSLWSQPGLRDMYQDDTSFFSRIRKLFINEDGVILQDALRLEQNIISDYMKVEQ